MNERIGEPEYDLEDVYDNEISPLMATVIDVCNRVGMPMVATFACRNHEDVGLDLCTSSISRSGWQPSVIRKATKVITTHLVAVGMIGRDEGVKAKHRGEG